MADLINFKQALMAEAEKTQELPPVVMSESTDLGQMVSRITGVDNRGEGESAAALVGRYVDEFTRALNEEANADVLKIYQEVVDVIADKIIHVFGEISAAKTHAEEKAGEMEKIKNDILARDPYVAAHIKAPELNIDFPMFDWSAISVVGSKAYIIGRVNGSVTVDEQEVPESFSMHHFNLAVEEMKKMEGIKDVEFTPETSEIIINTIAENCTMPKEDIVVGFEYLKKATAFNQVINLLAEKDLDPSKIFSNILYFSGTIEKVSCVITAITSDIVDLGAANRKLIDDNISVARVYLELMAYYIAMHRETSYADALLLPNGALNKDTYDAFVAEGGKNIMIAHYIRAMFKDDLSAIPVRGVPASSIIKSATALEERVKRDIANVEQRIQIATNQARIAAFKHIAGQYINSAIAQLIPDADDVQKAAAANKVFVAVAPAIVHAINMYDISFMDAALSLIMEVSYPNTFVFAMFKKLGAAYVNRVDLGGNVDQAAIDIAETGVIADIVSEFVVKKLYCYEECKDMTPKAPVVPQQPAPAPAPAEGEPSEQPDADPNAAPAQEN